MDDLGTDRAEQQTSETAPSSTADDHRIGVPTRLDERPSGGRLAHRQHAGGAVSEHLLGQVCEQRLRLLHDRIVQRAGHNGMAGVVAGERPRMDHVKLRTAQCRLVSRDMQRNAAAF